MPYCYEIDRAERIAYVRGWGRLDLEETLQAPVELANHRDFEPGFGVVVDLRDLDYQPRPSDVVAIARNLVRLRKSFTHRMAFLAPERMARAAELAAAMASAGGVELRLFTDLAEAFHWVRPGPPQSPDWALEDPD